ncbi:MAG: DUF3419 family protein [Bacteriovoracaceae bacterium]|nr:DUF3419 family protein [Bacteriovoracaceae bacterium]
MAQKYFNDLNYTMANEDSSMERSIVAKLKSKKILSVCGSGARALALLNPNVEALDCADLSPSQLGLARLRVELIKKLDIEQYKMFWGYAPYSPNEHKEQRKEVFRNLELSQSDKDLFENLHKQNSWESLLYKGKWESSFCGFGKLTQVLFGHKALELFQFSELKAQQEYLDKSFPWKRWNFLIKIIGNRATFNALLYKGDFIKKNIPVPYFDYYSNAFKHLFYNGLVRENFFLQLCILGGIKFEQGNIVEAKDKCYQEMKQFLSSNNVGFLQEDIISAAKQGNYDYISLSDVPSYFSGDQEENFLQELKENLNPGAVVLIRNYLRVPNADRTGFKSIVSDFQQEIDQEKTQMYRVEILQKL